MMTGEVTDLTVYTHKSAEPDSVPAHVPKVCADRLVGGVQVVVPVRRGPLAQQSLSSAS